MTNKTAVKLITRRFTKEWLLVRQELGHGYGLGCAFPIKYTSCQTSCRTNIHVVPFSCSFLLLFPWLLYRLKLISMTIIIQVIKNIKNVAGCRDTCTRTAKVRKQLGMIALMYFDYLPIMQGQPLLHTITMSHFKQLFSRAPPTIALSTQEPHPLMLSAHRSPTHSC